MKAFFTEGRLGRPLLIYAFSRLYMALFMVLLAHYSTIDFTGRSSPAFDYWTVASTGDANWYREIAETGYPKNLLIYDDGSAGKSSWAFYPLWPLLCRLVMSVTHLPFYQVASVTALLLGAGVAILFYKLLHQFPVSEKARLYALAFLFFAPTGVVFSLAYSEALAFLLLLATLILWRKKQWWAMLIPMFFLSLTRPVVLALAFAFVLVAFYHVWKEKQAWREQKIYGVLALAAGFFFSLWPLLLAVKFARWDAYLYVQEAWRQYYTEPILPWLTLSPHESISTALILLVLFAALSYGYWRAAWPLELKAWAFGYLLFILLTVPAGSSYLSDFKNGTMFYPSTLRYLSLLLIPPVLFSLSPKGRRLQVGLSVTVVLATVTLTILYFRYFVLSFPTLKPYFWL